MGTQKILDSDMDVFIKEYYKEKYSEYEPKKLYFKRPRFLVVEDDISFEPLWRFIFNEVSTKSVWEWVDNADEAEKRIKKALMSDNPYDLVISDIFLTGPETGFDLWKKCGQTQNNMILVSGMDYENFLGQLSDEAYVPPYLRKPLDIKESIQAVNKSLVMSYF